MWHLWLAVCVALALTFAAGSASAKTHRVRKGNTLDSIARAYGVSVPALQKANGLGGSSKIRIGQKLQIPGTSAPKSKKTPKSKKKSSKKKSGKKAAKSGKAAKGRAPTGYHMVRKGQLPGSIAKQYGITVAALLAANGISSPSKIRSGHRLIIPHPSDRNGKVAREFKKSGREPSGSGGSKSKATGWRKYKRTPKKWGHITLLSMKTGDKWTGRAVGARRSVPLSARKQFRKLMANSKKQTHRIDTRLIQLLAKVSDTFGGRPIEVVSGYRLKRARRTSRHRHGRAMDFRVVGVPIKLVRDYIRTFKNVGVGWYPKSGFVHLDTRSRWTYWIDYAAPGKPSRYGGFWHDPKKAPR